MLRLEVFINKNKIAKVGVIRGEEWVGTEYTYNIYDIRGSEKGDKASDFPKIGEVKHSPSNGASKLTELVSKKLEKKHFS